MNLGEFRDELQARGFSYLSDARANQIVNDAITELEEQAHWPFREDSAQGAAPLSIPTLGTIEAVVNEDQEYVLEPRSYQWLLDHASSLGESGPGRYFYVSWPSGSPVVNTWPDNGDTIGVQFWALSTELTVDGSEPLTPERWHSTILLIAQRMAENERGNLQIAQGLQVEIDRQVNRMFQTLLGGQQAFGPDLTRVTYASEDW
jgi:hypothetical protein